MSKAEGESEKQQRSPPPLTGGYTQINVLFPSTSVELPSAEKFKEFPEEAQKAILAAFRIEQQHRNQWLSTQQRNDHELNMLRQMHAFWIRLFGLVAIIVLVVASLGFGAWLIQMKETAWGVALILGSVATLIGTAIYGQRARSMPGQAPRTATEPVDTGQLPQK